MRSVEYSARFIRAVRAERNRLARRRDSIQRKADALRIRLNRERRKLEALDRLIAEKDAILLASTGSKASDADDQPTGNGTSISGRTIRHVAIRVLLETPERIQPIHYRDWFKLVIDAGYEVRGKRPDAVFANQIMRSPVVKPANHAGYYELDRTAPDRIRSELEQLERQLTTVDQPTKQSALFLEIKQCRRHLTEALEALSDDPGPS